MEPSTSFKYGSWFVVGTMVAVGLGAANTYDAPGIATTWITWALLVYIISLQYRISSRMDRLGKPG